MTIREKTREERFIESIERLGNGELAMLRRGCGARDPVEGRCPWLLSLIQGVTSEATAFLVASLLAQYKTAGIRAGVHRDPEGNFGITWKRAIAQNDSQSLERRFHILLDSEYDPRTGEGDLPYRLRQMIRIVAGKSLGLDWPNLLIDLRLWDRPGKYIQKRWARSFFTTGKPDDANKTKEAPEKKE